MIKSESDINKDSILLYNAGAKTRSRPSSPEKLQRIVINKDVDIRKSVLNGCFYSPTISSDEWASPSFKLLVFVSSTFTDTQLERNYLMDELLFSLRRDAKPYGIQVIFADMRWGIRDENTNEHKTWIECANALHWCKQQSLGICFLSLQGDKYGYTPLPKSILQTALDNHLIANECNDEMKRLIYEWYILDDNAIP